MARNTPREAPRLQSLPKDEGLRRLKALQERGRALLTARPLREGQEDVWSNACLELIRAVFGSDSNHQSTFIGPIRVLRWSDDSDRGYDQDQEQGDAEKIEGRG